MLLKNKDALTCFCVNYGIAEKDSYPPPELMTVLTLFPDTSFSTLDLHSKYWQVEMDQKDKEKTAFTLQCICYL